MDHEGLEGNEEDGMNDANIDETMIVVCQTRSIMRWLSISKVEIRSDMG